MPLLPTGSYACWIKKFSKAEAVFELFEEAVVDADRQMRLQEVPIHARPYHAIDIVSKILGLESEPIPINVWNHDEDDYSATAIFSQVHLWYEKRYGERLKVHPGPGSFAIRIRGDAWKVNLPLVYGRVNFLVDRDVGSYVGHPNPGFGNEIPDYNVLLCIEDFPVPLANDLGDGELLEVLREVMFALDVLQGLSNIEDEQTLIDHARADLRVAVDNLVSSQQNYGLSKWSSLQFTEKLMKWKLSSNGVAYPNTHNLQKLSKLGSDKGLFELGGEPVSKVQCSAAIRYGEESTSLISAMDAHRSSILIAGQLVDGGFSYD